MFTHTLRRIAAATLLGGALVVTPVMAQTATAGETDCGYELAGTSNTQVTIEDNGTFEVGEDFTVTATVTVTGPDNQTAPATGGQVVFTYAGESVTDTTVVNGEASATFEASTETPVTAEYSGVCVLGSAGVAGSSGTDLPDILGVEGEDGGDNGGTGGTSGGISGADSGLGGTGMSTQTELYGLLGLGLVAVGGMTLMVHRRREQA